MRLLTWLLIGLICGVVASCVIYAQNKKVTQRDMVELAVFPLLGWLGVFFILDILIKGRRRKK